MKKTTFLVLCGVMAMGWAAGASGCGASPAVAGPPGSGGSGAGGSEGGCCAAPVVQAAMCDPDTKYAVQLYPGLSASELARRVTAYAPNTAADTKTVKGESIAGAQVLVLVKDGVVAAPCAPPTGAVIEDGGLEMTVGQGVVVEFTLH